MKRTELKEVKGLDIKELSKKVKDSKKELAGLVIEKSGQSSAKGAKDVKLVSKKKRDIAQIWTILRQKELLEQLSVLSGQLSDNGQSVVGESVTDKQKTEKPKSENRKQKTDNRKKKGDKTK